MNTTGWGGARVGGGRKPEKPRRPPKALQAFEGGKVEERLPASGDVSGLPPEDLPANQRAFWHNNAPLAIEKRTLTVHTVEAFRLLCELDAEKRSTMALMDAQGRTFIKVTVDGAGVEHQELKAHPLTGAYGRLAKAVENLMGRFGLAPFGKAELPMAKKTAANPWTAVGGR